MEQDDGGVDVLQFLSDDFRPSSYLEDDLSEPTSGFSTSPPSSPDTSVSPFVPDFTSTH